MANLDPLREAVTARAIAIHEAAVDLMLGRLILACPIDTGELRDSIDVDSSEFGTSKVLSKIVAPVPQARYQDEGTGIYGPVGERITSPNGRPLAFFWKRMNVEMVVWSVAGSPATHWWSQTCTAAAWAEVLAEAVAA
jgi:hypothetical protein